MTDETANLALERLKRLRADMSLMRGMRIEMTGVKQHIAAFMAHEVKQDMEIGSIKDRRDRAERRLDLME